MRTWWISSRQATASVSCRARDGLLIISATPPIWHKFMGQPLGNLIDWLRSNDRQEPWVQEITVD